MSSRALWAVAGAGGSATANRAATVARLTSLRIAPPCVWTQDRSPTREGPRSAFRKGAVEGLGEVGHEIVGVLDADGVADEIVLDADLQAFLGRELVEAHDRRLLDQALDAAERGRDVGDRARVHQARGRVEIAADLERHHPPEPAHLPPGDVVAGV